jgi:hypothetical protein
MEITYPPQSNGADFYPETLQFVAMDDGLPVWAAIPADMVATLTIKTPCGATILKQTSTDSSGAVIIREDGFIDMFVDDSGMAGFGEGEHTLFLKIAIGSYTSQAVIGHLPIYGGA